MSGHLLDQQPEERLFTQIKELQDQIKELRTLQLQGTDAVNIAVTSNYTATKTGLVSGGGTVFTYTLTPAVAKILISTFHFTLYETSVATANVINGTDVRSYNYDWRWWRDWGQSDNNNVKDYVWVRNNTGSTQTVVMRANWRYIINGGTAGVV